MYHDQQSEIFLGKALAGGYRERVRRLQTGTIDFCLLHGLSRERWTFIQQLNLLPPALAAEVLQAVEAAAMNFIGDAHVSDDMTMSWSSGVHN